LVIHLKGGITLDDTLKQIISSPDFKYLTARDKEQSITSSTKEFNTNKKSGWWIATSDNGQITHPYCNTGYKN
jgi:hypothetical protein